MWKCPEREALLALPSPDVKSFVKNECEKSKRFSCSLAYEKMILQEDFCGKGE